MSAGTFQFRQIKPDDDVDKVLLRRLLQLSKRQKGIAPAAGAVSESPNSNQGQMTKTSPDTNTNGSIGISIGNQADTNGDTPLHLAVVGWLEHTVELLIKLGARLTTRNKQGSTPAHLAAPSSPLNKEDSLMDMTSLQDRILALLITGATAGSNNTSLLNQRNDAGDTPREILTRHRVERQRSDWLPSWVH